MFDDPKKELRRLEEELLAAEEESWLTDDDLDLDDIQALLDGDQEDEDYSDLFEEVEEMPRYRNYSNNYGRRSAAMRFDDEEELDDPDEDEVLYKEDYKKAKKAKKKENRGLIFLAILETAAILAISAWWVLWLL